MTAHPPHRAGRDEVLVIGGGLAGVSTALALTEAGLSVTLVESRPRLGGLASSFRRETATGALTADNGQHVHLRCCTAYQWFLDRVGGRRLAPVQGRLNIPVLHAGTGRLGHLRRGFLPVPLHLAGALGGYPHLPPAERLTAARAALALRRLDPADPALDDEDFATWLRRHGQSPRAVAALWDLVGVATLNARAAHASLALAAKVFRTGLLTTPDAADLGWARVPLGELHHNLARAALERAGARVLLAARARGLTRQDDGGWLARVEYRGTGPDRPSRHATADPVTTPPPGPTTVRPLRGAALLRADAVVLAVPPLEAHRLLPPGALPDPDRLLRLGTAPILNAHVVYDRPVLHRPFLAALASPVQWVFDRTRPSGLADTPEGRGGQYLVLSQSAAHDDIDRPVAELRRRYLPALETLLPAARRARVRDFFVTRERAATFAPAPGTGRLRPGVATRLPGLCLAGAWTATGWPATMEGAVRSGLTAAQRILHTVGKTRGDPEALREPV